MIKRGFTIAELIFVIVVIGILAAVAIPKFSGLTKNSKITSELATASTIQSAIEDVHSEWVVSEGSFTWGNGKTQNDLTNEGYPKQLGDCQNNHPFNWILKNSSTLDAKWSCSEQNGKFFYRGPASTQNSGVANNPAGKPDANDCWIYDPHNGSFELHENCN